MNFDRVSGVYDDTRTLPDTVAELVADRIVAATGAMPKTRFLEIGVGSGRVALPLVLRGYQYTGVDLSAQMMERLRAKAPQATNLQLVQSDITQLPLPDDSVDVALAVHVLHLFPEWEKALDEVVRVLAPGGYFVLGADWTDPESAASVIRQHWRVFATEQGVTLLPRYGTWEKVEAALINRGARCAAYRVAAWTQQEAPVKVIEAFRHRAFSQTWEVPDDALEAAHERLLAWAREEYGDLDRAAVLKREFHVLVSWWEGA